MKIILGVLLMILGVTSEIQAQMVAEFTKQDKTHLKYMLKQIAGLQVYIGHIRRGYQIAEKGLTTIRRIKDGDLNLHRDFFNGLSNVNPRVKNTAKVADIISCQFKIVQTYSRSMRRLRGSDQFAATELQHIGLVYSRLLTESMENVEQLILLLSPGQFQLRDDERLQRIDGVHKKMDQTYAMVRQFEEDNLVMAVHRAQDRNDGKILKKLYNLSNE